MEAEVGGRAILVYISLPRSVFSDSQRWNTTYSSSRHTLRKMSNMMSIRLFLSFVAGAATRSSGGLDSRLSLSQSLFATIAARRPPSPWRVRLFRCGGSCGSGCCFCCAVRAVRAGSVGGSGAAASTAAILCGFATILEEKHATWLHTFHVTSRSMW